MTIDRTIFLVFRGQLRSERFSLLALRGRVMLSVGVLMGNFIATERQKVTAVYFDSRTVGFRACKGPFGHAMDSRHEVAGPTPVGIRKGSPYL